MAKIERNKGTALQTDTQTDTQNDASPPILDHPQLTEQPSKTTESVSVRYLAERFMETSISQPGCGPLASDAPGRGDNAATPAEMDAYAEVWMLTCINLARRAVAALNQI